MRELILLRHAHADAAGAGQDDLQRALSATGIDEAHAAGAWLREQGLQPDRVLCSPAARTWQTLAALGDIGNPDVREEDAVYEASVGELIALADAHRDANRLLLVGHNPGLEQLAALMHSGQSGDYRGMPPAGIAVLRIPADAALEPGIATLAAFWWP
ncbi:histidine phosphatase family protein [Thermomonas brevis]